MRLQYLGAHIPTAHVKEDRNEALSNKKDSHGV